MLVEPQHEDETKRLDAASQGKLKQVYEQQNEMEKSCAAQAEQGFKPGSEELRAAQFGGYDRAGAAITSRAQPQTC